MSVRRSRHTPFPGAAIVENGIVIDLNNLPASGLSADRRKITVSPSQKWDEVYELLDTYNLSTLGGRVAGVGVGGLITGCGISYFSPRYGFACDLVILGTGEILTPSSTRHADLWKALRGGSNNFGIVTKFTLRTFPQGPFWGGQTFHTIDTRSNHFAAHEDLIAAYPFDPYVHFINTLLITNMTGSKQSPIHNIFSEPSPLSSHPEALHFTPADPPLFPGLPPNTLRIDNVTSFSREYAAQSAYKKRWTFATISFGNSATMMEIFFQITNATIQPLINLPGFQLSLSYQPLPTALTSRHRAIDSLGPLQTEGNMFMIHWAMAVDDEAKSYDEKIQEWVKVVFQKAGEAANELGLKRDFLALTYADG
ncbi:hypothetical protein AC579_5008 [Pseudocercospora musae]|uniref:FAD-binding PCMH-type domain-containing protein n=1 Tax=Pseudocercospora musae TaxID=113226 RepID=A0A139I8S5_9PEZI|nr:hypothetical protein AC579_5008 [Pseudocercospora musae]